MPRPVGKLRRCGIAEELQGELEPVLGDLVVVYLSQEDVEVLHYPHPQHDQVYSVADKVGYC